MDYIFYSSGRTWHIVKGTIDYKTYQAEMKRSSMANQMGYHPGDGDMVQHLPPYLSARANVLCGSLSGSFRPNGFDIETGSLETISFKKAYQAWFKARSRDLILGYRVNAPQIMIDAPFPPAPLCGHCTKIARSN